MDEIETQTFKDVFGDHSNEVYKGSLNISGLNLTSLEGCYKAIQGYFDCSNNYITSFEFCPDVRGDFYCSDNEITSFEFCPYIQGDFDCSGNQITSFEHCPNIKGALNCSDNEITSFEFCPDVQFNFNCSNNFITSFEHCPKIKDNLDCSHNQITSFEFCPNIRGNFDCTANPNLQIETDESLEGLLSANIQGTLYSRLDLSVFKEYKKIYKNTRDFKKFKLLKDFIGLGN